LSERYVPDPFIFAILLTLLTFAIGAIWGQSVATMSWSGRVGHLMEGWFSEFYGTGLMKFALQMCIVLITGHALAVSKPAQQAVKWLTRLASTPAAAVVVVTVVACLASLIQWGMGAIVGAFTAREMGKRFAQRGIDVHYPLLGAAGYAGFLVWHGGFSGSAPLKVAESGHFVADQIGVVSISETILSPLNLIVIGVLLLIIPALLSQLHPREDIEVATDFLPDEELFSSSESGESASDESNRSRVVEIFEESYLLNVAIGGFMAAVLVGFFGDKGIAGWNLDSINLLFLTAGIFAHRSPTAYLEAIKEGTTGAAGIILQFPFYFGILGVLKVSGLIEQIATFFVQISTVDTFPVFAFLSAGIVNFFVPSGGGQWAVQGQVLMEAANELGLEPARVIMAFSYGDAWTNMLQPFWALPLLGIMELEAKDIIGYTALVLFVSGPVMMLLLFLL
jgi:short-chain fatty acids transporter